MADIDVSFIHPTDGRLLNVQLDDTITAQEAIAELISVNFIPQYKYPRSYALAIKGGNMIGINQYFRDANVQNGAILQIVPQTDAGYSENLTNLKSEDELFDERRTSQKTADFLIITTLREEYEQEKYYL